MPNHVKIALNDILQKIVKESRLALTRQGHKDTGELINSVGGRVREISDGLSAEISFLEYGLAQDTGIKANKIPFREGSGASRSKYIDALTAWVKRKGIEGDAVKAKGIAFAIAKTHKKFGMHTSGGKGNSKFDKSKQGWFSGTINKLEPEIEVAVGLAVGNNIGALIDTLVDESNRNLNVS